MKRSLPFSPNTIPDQQRIEERGPGGAIITTTVSSPSSRQQHQQLEHQPNASTDYYRSTSASSMKSYYSASSTDTVFGSSVNGHGDFGGGEGGGGGGTDIGGRQQSEQSSASLSSLDCFNSIGSSLKRVKISTSPGELRLNKDIEAMAHGQTGHGHRNGNGHQYVYGGHEAHHGVQQRQQSAELEWISVDESGGGGGTSNCTMSSNPECGVQYHRTLQSSDGTVIVRRDIVDPLRLRISVTFRTERPWEMRGWGVMAHSDPSDIYETWTYLVQIPRMYPHSPPLVRRITREGGSMPSNITELVRQQRQQHQQEQQMRQQQLAHQYSSESKADTAAIPLSPSATHGCPSGPPMVERIIISSNPSMHPPSAEDGEMTGICIDSDPSSSAGSDPLTGTMATFGGWSPISRLSDLVAFLAELPVKRLEAWAARGGTGGETRGPGPDDVNSRSRSTCSATGTSTSASCGPSYQNYQEQPYELGFNGSKRGVVRRHASTNDYDCSDYSGMPMDNNNGVTAKDRTSHLDRQRRRTSQESEVDVSAIRLASGSAHSGSEHDVSMERGQVTYSTLAPRHPSKLEDPFHPNRFNKGFDRSSSAPAANVNASSHWRSTSAPDVVTSPSEAPPPSGCLKKEHWQQKSVSENVALNGSRLPVKTALGSGWGVGANTSPTPPPEHSSTVDSTSFRESNVDDPMMDD